MDHPSPTPDRPTSWAQAWRRQAAGPSPRTAVALTVGLLAMVAAALAGVAVAEVRPPWWTLAADLLVGVVGSVLLPHRLHRPLPLAVGAVALSAVSPAATPLAGTATLWAAGHLPLPVAVPVAAGGVGAQVLRGLWRPLSGVPLGWWLLLVAAAYAAVVGWGAWWQAHRQVVDALVERARRAEAEQAARVEDARRAERVRIAREMHDVLAHRLSLLATFAGAITYHRDAPTDRLVEAAEVIRSGAHQALEDLRQVIDVLREGDGPGSGGTAPPQPTLADLERLLEESRRAGTEVALEDHRSATGEVPAALGRTAYRVVQEALTNARKHAPGHPVRVRLDGAPGGELLVEVVNAVPAHRAAPAVPGSGTGLVGMAERVELAGGRLEVDGSGDGFRVAARLPWPA